MTRRRYECMNIATQGQTTNKYINLRLCKYKWMKIQDAPNKYRTPIVFDILRDADSAARPAAAHGKNRRPAPLRDFCTIRPSCQGTIALTGRQSVLALHFRISFVMAKCDQTSGRGIGRGPGSELHIDIYIYIYVCV